MRAPNIVHCTEMNRENRPLPCKCSWWATLTCGYRLPIKSKEQKPFPNRRGVESKTIPQAAMLLNEQQDAGTICTGTIEAHAITNKKTDPTQESQTVTTNTTTNDQRPTTPKRPRCRVTANIRTFCTYLNLPASTVAT